MSSSEEMNAFSDESREELISIISELKAENSSLKNKFNEYKNESKKRQKISGSEALDRQTVNKKSFSDRICDDLCEEILQYLSLEDKLKLEGVSKQFQRTVLKKHYELEIVPKSCTPNRETNEDIKYLYIEDIFIDLKSLEILLKKCPNITSIVLSDEYDYNPVFPLITRHCNNLREIDFEENEINDENIEEFQRKFGPKIDFIYFKDGNNYNLFPNIKKIIALYLDPCPNEFFSRQKLNKLKKLELKNSIEEEDIIKVCVDTFPKLTHLDFKIMSEKENAIYKSLEIISNLKNLKHFCLDYVFIKFHKNTKLFCDSLKRMANKCQKLKSIECGFIIDSENSDIKQLLSVFVAFTALKRLNLDFSCEYQINFDIDELFPFEALKGLSNITHLTFGIHESISLNFFKDIDINLPKLQYLEFKDEIDVTPEEVTQMAVILSRLSRLQTLKLLFDKDVDYNEIEVKIREKCSKIRIIDLKHNNNE